MELLLVLALVIGGVYWFVVYPEQKIKRLKNNVVVEVDGAEIRYPNLPLGNLGIFFTANAKNRVQVVFPSLTLEGDVQYIYSWHGLPSVHLPGQVPQLKPSETQTGLNLRVAQELATLMKEHIRFVEPEISNLRKQWNKINDLLDLISTSDFYASQQETHERALFQVEQLLEKAETLQQVYIRFIREVLIGREIAGYDPDLLPDDSVAIDSQYRQIRDEYLHMKETAIAYTQLLESRQI
ncbi:MAG: hypothetical protein SFY66_02965 [Oculatellaceae cyanobacterium bins.114]|nr:hypothetical protein [Oculatellaceae cyanobacterium bins.114]